MNLRSLQLLVRLAALVWLGTPSPAASPTADYAAHEWGTFTSIQGSDGTPIPWNPFTAPTDLPDFVHHRQLPTRNSGVLCPKAGHIRSLGLKDSNSWLQRMETPVIYFHAKEPLTVDVHVRFASGLITEWFPQVSAFGPVAGVDDLLPATDESHLRWASVQILAPSLANDTTIASSIPESTRPSHYLAARQTSANLVQSTRPFAEEPFPQRDRFLFYRGAGDFRAPLRTSVPPDDNSVNLSNQGSEPLGPLFVVQVARGKTAFTTVPSLAVNSNVTIRLPVPTAPSGSGILGSAVRDALQDAGLFRDEAEAMVQTWNESWFGEDGVRVLYLLPQAWTDQVLPLALQPEPRSLVRVMVGRAELLKRSQESVVSGWIADYADGNGEWAVASLRALGLGRFLEPAITRCAGLTRTAQLGAMFSCRFQPSAASIRPRMLSEESWREQIARLKNALRDTELASR
jgi:hypothetical protein